jgi:hypothetical protein
VCDTGISINILNGRLLNITVEYVVMGNAKSFFQ